MTSERKDADQCCGCDEHMDLVAESVVAYELGAEGLGFWHPRCLASFIKGAQVQRSEP